MVVRPVGDRLSVETTNEERADGVLAVLRSSAPTSSWSPTSARRPADLQEAMSRAPDLVPGSGGAAVNLLDDRPPEIAAAWQR